MHIFPTFILTPHCHLCPHFSNTQPSSNSRLIIPSISHINNPKHIKPFLIKAPLASHIQMATTPLIVLLFLVCSVVLSFCSDFSLDFDVTWGDGDHVKIVNNGDLVTLSLDQTSGSCFQSKKEFLFGKIDMQIKLVPGNSAGTVTSYCLSSKGQTWDEIDFEFLGNLSGDPYTLHTNVITQGKRDREVQFHLWFDPTLDFHTYSILWNPLGIIFFVDNIPIREYKNLESRGILFPENQPMRLSGSLWNADDWATRGGQIKTDWSKAPFTASFRGFTAKACMWVSGESSCNSGPPSSAPADPTWLKQTLTPTSTQWLNWVRNNYMIYNYCTDTKRFPQGLPPECAFSE